MLKMCRALVVQLLELRIVMGQRIVQSDLAMLAARSIFKLPWKQECFACERLAIRSHDWLLNTLMIDDHLSHLLAAAHLHALVGRRVVVIPSKSMLLVISMGWWSTRATPASCAWDGFRIALRCIGSQINTLGLMALLLIRSKRGMGSQVFCWVRRCITEIAVFATAGATRWIWGRGTSSSVCTTLHGRHRLSI
jgi:hypothetical protein